MAQSKKNGKTNRTGRTAKQKRMPRYEADSLAACLMVGILLLATGILTLLGAGFGLQHEVFRYLRQFSSSMFGSMTLLMTFALIAAGVALLISTTRKVSRRYVASYAILVVLLSGFVSLMTFVTSSEGQFPLLDYIAQKTGSDAFSGMMSRSMTYGMKGYGGGMVGMLLAWPLWKFFGAGLGAVILGLLMAVDVLVGGWRKHAVRSRNVSGSWRKNRSGFAKGMRRTRPIRRIPRRPTPVPVRRRGASSARIRSIRMPLCSP